MSVVKKLVLATALVTAPFLGAKLLRKLGTMVKNIFLRVQLLFPETIGGTFSIKNGIALAGEQMGRLRLNISKKTQLDDLAANWRGSL